MGKPAFLLRAGLAIVMCMASAGPLLAGQAGPGTANRPSGPRTPWGDPDLQGTYTNLWEVGTPFERPDELAGRRLADIKGDELVKIRKGIQDRTRNSNLDEQLRGPREVWLDQFKHEKGSVAWFVIEPEDGKIPALTAAAQKRLGGRRRQGQNEGGAASWLDLSLYERCITRGYPASMMPTLYGNSYDIVQAPGVVAIRYEMVHETRVIPLDDRPRPADALRSYMGEPRGHWEGDTLVVETMQFKDAAAYRNANGATLKITERFSRSGPDKVLWTVTVQDPETWTKPWSFAVPLTADANEPVFEYACHEGNYNMTNILGGARADEAAAAREKASKK
jgi:hypothetical protein